MVKASSHYVQRPFIPISISSFLTFPIFFFFRLYHLACRILVPGPGIEPVPPAVETWSLKHWTTRAFPILVFFFFSIRLLAFFWASLVVQMVKNPPAMWETWVRSLGWEDPLEKGTATHSSILPWRIPWTEESGRLQSMGSESIRHDWVTHTQHILNKFYLLI